MVKMWKEKFNHKTLFYHLLVHVVPNPFFLLWNINFDARLDDCLSHHLLSLYGRKTQLKWMGTESITYFFHKRKSYKFQHCKLWQNFHFLFNLFFILFIKVMFLWNITTWPLRQLKVTLLLLLYTTDSYWLRGVFLDARMNAELDPGESRKPPWDLCF